MTAHHHLSLDTIADYLAELLPAAEADAVAVHLSTCSRCAADAETVQQVPAILSSAARAPLPMPEAVTSALDDVLHSETESRSSVVRLADRRSTTQGSSGVSRSKGPLLVAAAAVLAVVGVAGAVRGLGGLGAGQSALSSDSSTAESSVAGGAAAAAPGTPSGLDQSKALPRGLSPQNLPAYAERLTGFDRPPTRSTSAQAIGVCAAPQTSASGVVTVRRWKGAPAVIVVDPTSRRVTVLDCRTAATELYATGY